MEPQNPAPPTSAPPAPAPALPFTFFVGSRSPPKRSPGRANSWLCRYVQHREGTRTKKNLKIAFFCSVHSEVLGVANNLFPSKT